MTNKINYKRGILLEDIHAILSGIYRVRRVVENHLRLRRYLFSEYIHRKETKAAGKTLRRSSTFSSLSYCMGEKRPCFCERFSCDLKN